MDGFLHGPSPASTQLSEAGFFPGDTEKSYENELKGAFALPGCLSISLLPVPIRKCAEPCGCCWPEAREHYRSLECSPETTSKG